MPSATPADRRRRLEELLLQRVLARVARQSTVDAATGASTVAVRDATLAQLRAISASGAAVSEKQLSEVADAIAARFPRIAENVAPTGNSPTRKGPVLPTMNATAANASVSTRSALLFPPLQAHSPRSRTIMVPHPPGATAATASSAQEVPPRTASDLPQPPLLSRESAVSSAYPKPPYALDNTPPAAFPQRPGSISTARTLHQQRTLLSDDDDGLSGSRSSRPPRRPREDVWSQIALFDQEKYRDEITHRQMEKRSQRDAHSDFLRTQIESKKLEEERKRIEEAKVQQRVEHHLSAQDHKRLQEEMKRKAKEDEMKREIDRQLRDAAARKERQRLRAEHEGRVLKEKYDQALEDEKKTTDARRWQAFLVHQESLQYNEILEQHKAEQKLKEQEEDKAAVKVQQQQAELAEARRTAHHEKIRQKATRAKLMAATLQASAEEQARAATERAEREAAAKRAEEDRLAALKAEKKKQESAAIRAELERQMQSRRAAEEEEQARDAAIAAALRDRDAHALEENKRRAAAKRLIAEQHRHDIERQIALREEREREPLGLTATEQSLNRRVVAELQQRATPAVVAW